MLNDFETMIHLTCDVHSWFLSGHVRFIDYEYSSYNYQAFDIGNHFNEFAGLIFLMWKLKHISMPHGLLTVCVWSGMAELDYGLYPSREMQMDWLRVYLQAYKLFTKKTEEVSTRELETLYVQVNKFALVSRRNMLASTHG